MKKLILLLTFCVSLFFLNSCREDGDWGNDNGGQFGFTIERDDNFIEKAVGETNQLKFNIVPSYNFNSIQTKFKFVTNLNGVLKLNGEVLVANKEYIFDEKENIFEYVGNVSGTHELKISVKNDKGASKEEEFELKYAVSEFSHTYTGGTAPIYQGDETQYLMKIVAGNGLPTTGYQIKFNTYDGTVKFNGVPATLGTFYAINNIDNFNISLSTNQGGQGKLTYTIKNATVSKDYEILQTVIVRQITIESMNLSKTQVPPNTALSLIGVVKKTPTTPNLTVQYKTWVSSASNNNINGIQNTNNAYISYPLSQNGNFIYNFNAIEVGNYTYNIQFKDEFGNESEVKSFNIQVENNVTINTISTTLLFKREVESFILFGDQRYRIRHSYLGAKFAIDATASTGNGISKIVCDIKFDYKGTPINKSYTYNYTAFPQNVNEVINANDPTVLYYNQSTILPTADPFTSGMLTNGEYTITIYDKFNNIISKTGSPIMLIQ